MAEAHPETIESTAESGRVKRPPPTIDLEATEVTGAPDAATGAEPNRSSRRPKGSAISTFLIAAVTGACAAALVIAVAGLLGWPGQPAAPAPPAVPAVNTAALDDLAARVAGVEAKLGKPAAPAPDAARLDALEKSLAALRGDLTAL